MNIEGTKRIQSGTVNFNKNLALWIVIGLLVFALFNLFQGSYTRSPQNALAFSDFLVAVKSGEVNNVKIQGKAIVGNFRDGRTFQTYAPDDPNLVSKQIHVEVED